MSVKTTVIGAFPKIGDDLPSQELRRALHRRDREEIDDAELARVYDAVTRGAIGEIESAGVDVVNDGQIRWDDLLAPFARAWSGVAPGPLERFYDNNTYFRQPVISGPLEGGRTSLARDFTFARTSTRAALKAAVCGPLTFASLARDDYYRSFEDRVLAVADALGDEVAALRAAGAEVIDVEDPAIVALPQHIELARTAYGRLALRGARLHLVTYFFPADPILESLASFSVAGVGIDVRSRPTTALVRLDAFRTQTVVLGAVEARNTRLEDAAEVAGYVERALRLVPPERLWVAPTTSLEYLPRDVARAKLDVLVQGARLAAGEKVLA